MTLTAWMTLHGDGRAYPNAPLLLLQLLHLLQLARLEARRRK